MKKGRGHEWSLDKCCSLPGSINAKSAHPTEMTDSDRESASSMGGGVSRVRVLVILLLSQQWQIIDPNMLMPHTEVCENIKC